MNASVVVVGVEKPFGSRWMNSSRHVAPRRAEARRQIGNRPLGEVAGEPVQHARCPAAAPASPACAPTRAPTTRSYSPSRATSRARVGRPMLAVGVDDQDEVARSPARMPVFTAAPLPLLYGCRTTRAPRPPRARPCRRSSRRRRRGSSCHAAAARSAGRPAARSTAASLKAGMTTRRRRASPAVSIDQSARRRRPT